MAQWRPMSYKTEPVITNLGDGINSGTPALSLKDSEMTYLREMDSKDYPAISVRPGRYVTNFALSTKVNAFHSMDMYSYLLIANDADLIVTYPSGAGSSAIQNTLTTTLSTGASAHGNFATLIINSTWYTVYLNGDGNKKYFTPLNLATTAENITDTNCINTRIVITYKNRIFIAGSNYIVFSALNSVTDWTTANNAGRITLPTLKGRIMALAVYDDNLIIFGLQSTHVLYGSGPDTYTIRDIDLTIGNISMQRGVAECNGKLYWVSLRGIHEYDGARIRIISDPIKDYFDKILKYPTNGTPVTTGSRLSAIGYGSFVYFSVPIDGGSGSWNNLILKYDTEHQIWFVEEGNIYHMQVVDGQLRGIDYSGNIFNMRSTSISDKLTTGGSETPISWSFITKPFTEGIAGRDKVLSELNIVASISTASTAFSVGYSTNIENNDSTSFTSLFSTNAGSSNAQMRRIQVPATQLQNVPWYRLRFAGSGPATVNFLEKNVRVKRR